MLIILILIMGNSQPIYTQKQKEQIITSIPNYLDEIVSIKNDLTLDRVQKEQKIYNIFHKVFNTNISCLKKFNESFICGLATSYIAYLDIEDKTDEAYIKTKSLDYMNKLINVVDNNLIFV